MKKHAVTLCLTVLSLLIQVSALAITRPGMIMLEGMEEPIEETLFESSQGYSFWYVSDGFSVDSQADQNGDVTVKALYTDDYMTLSLCTPAEAAEYLADSEMKTHEPSSVSHFQRELSLELKNGSFHFFILISDHGHYLKATGVYSLESAEGNAHYFQRVLDSITFRTDRDKEFLRELPGVWTEEIGDKGAILTLEENRNLFLACYDKTRGITVNYTGIWNYESDTEHGNCLKLQLNSTDNPLKAESVHSMECVYAAYMESYVDNDTLITVLKLSHLLRSGGIFPLEELFGYDGGSLYQEKKPNMQVVNCRESVTLREQSSTSSKGLDQVPLGATVLAFPETGEENGFVRCIYHGQEGYIFSKYLQTFLSGQ